MRRLIVLFVMLYSLANISAQQDGIFSHIFFDKVKINPAFAGNEGDICVGIINRQQWTGFDGAPKTTAFNANAPLNIGGINSGIGISLMDDRLGFNNNFVGSLQYAYFRNIGTGTLRFGVEGGIYNIAFDGNWVTSGGSADTDPAIPLEKDNSMIFDLAFGMAYTLGDLYVGLSATHLTKPKSKFTNSEQSYLQRHYYLISGYNIQLSGANLDLAPNILIQSDGASAQITINMIAVYNKKFWGGVSYRTPDAIDVMAGIELFNGIKIGYAYGLNFSKLISTNVGSHEIMLAYCFNIGFDKAPQKYRSVRFL